MTESLVSGVKWRKEFTSISRIGLGGRAHRRVQPLGNSAHQGREVGQVLAHLGRSWILV